MDTEQYLRTSTGRLFIRGTYPQDMRGGYVRTFAWKAEGGVLPEHAVNVLVAMLRGRVSDASEQDVYDLHNKAFVVVGSGARFGGELLAVYRHDDYWQVIAFSHADWQRTYGASRLVTLDPDDLPSYST